MIRLALSVIRVVRWFGHGLGRVLTIFVTPFGWLFHWSFRLVVLPIYTWYNRAKRVIAYHPRFVGIRSMGHFFQRYALYMVIVLVSVFGVTNNLLARTVRPDEVGQDSLWASLSSTLEDDVVVEVGSARSARSGALVAVGGATVVDAESTPAASSTNSSIENLAAVGSLDQATADAPRETVESYTVQGGDTVSTIAERFGVSSRTLLWANGLGEGDFIKPGQSLKIPSTSGYLYTVKSGDTLAKIAQTYKGKEDEILAANSLPLAEAIQAGQQIIIPGGEPPAPPPSSNPSNRTFLGVVVGGNAPPSAPASGARFGWPTVGRRINQYYRGRWHTGIDIDGEYSTPVYAARAGRVTYASADRSGYGLHVTIDHGNGFSTLYAHASKVFVRAGQSVTQGQTIAMQGCTGRCSGVHLHFEIRLRGAPLNPLSYY